MPTNSLCVFLWPCSSKNTSVIHIDTLCERQNPLRHVTCPGYLCVSSLLVLWPQSSCTTDDVVHLRPLRSAGRSLYVGWRKFKGHLKEGGRNLVAFVFGLLLATLYGVTALFLQKQPLWFCVYSTLTVAFLAAFGMGLSAGVRADVAVMLPSLCSGRSVCFQHLPQVLWGLRKDQ